MYRVIGIVGAGLVLAACSSTDSFKFENPFKFEPVRDTVRFESEPLGAEAKTSTGQTCRTPCALAVPTDKGFSVTFTLTGYQPATEELQLVSMGDGTSKLRPNPVLVQLTPVKPKKPVRRRVTAKPKPKPAAQRPAAPPPMTAAPQPQSTSPWPAAPVPNSQ